MDTLQFVSTPNGSYLAHSFGSVIIVTVYEPRDLHREHRKDGQSSPWYSFNPGPRSVRLLRGRLLLLLGWSL